jgi:hypothetical protein
LTLLASLCILVAEAIASVMACSREFFALYLQELRRRSAIVNVVGEGER